MRSVWVKASTASLVTANCLLLECMSVAVDGAGNVAKRVG